MQYREIVAVTGLGGLFHLLATKSDGAIVRSLADDTTKFIPSRLHNVTPLESIEIYTTGSNVRLHEVLQKMKDSDTPKPDGKKSNAEEIRTYFLTVFPDIDGDRVYTSDMKKMLKWFDILHGADLLDFSAMNAAQDDQGDGAAEGTPEDTTSMPAEGDTQLSEHNTEGDTDMPLVEDGDGAKPAKKARAKKADAGDEDEAEKAAKKSAVKKQAETGEDDTEPTPKKTAKKKKDGES